MHIVEFDFKLLVFYYKLILKYIKFNNLTDTSEVILYILYSFLYIRIDCFFSDTYSEGNLHILLSRFVGFPQSLNTLVTSYKYLF